MTAGQGELRGAVAVLLLCLPWGCSKPAHELLPAADAAVPAARTPAPLATAPSPSARTSAGKSAGKAAPTASSQPSGQPAGEAELVAAKGAAEEPRTELKTEEPEANPYSESVTLKVAVTPPVKAVVMWGAKQVAKLGPGSMDAEIVRPRGSGPVDLEIKADGYLPYHTRLYTDRDEKANVRLYRTEDAPGLFGYKRSSIPTGKPNATPTAKK